jgi:MAP3K TRAFs-binding domain
MPSAWFTSSTQLELAVLAKDENGAMDALAKTLSAIREAWEPKTTARNLQLIREAREARSEAPGWVNEIEDELKRKGERVLQP